MLYFPRSSFALLKHWLLTDLQGGSPFTRHNLFNYRKVNICQSLPFGNPLKWNPWPSEYRFKSPFKIQINSKWCRRRWRRGWPEVKIPFSNSQIPNSNYCYAQLIRRHNLMLPIPQASWSPPLSHSQSQSPSYQCYLTLNAKQNYSHSIRYILIRLLHKTSIFITHILV